MFVKEEKVVGLVSEFCSAFRTAHEMLLDRIMTDANDLRMNE